jgi:hypothetical protein
VAQPGIAEPHDRRVSFNFGGGRRFGFGSGRGNSADGGRNWSGGHRARRPGPRGHEKPATHEASREGEGLDAGHGAPPGK